MRPEIEVTDAASAYAYLAADSGATPCSRYGENGPECAVYAVAWMIYAIEDSAEWSIDYADGVMQWVVNDSDEPEELLAGGSLSDYYAQAFEIAARTEVNLVQKAYYIYQAKGQTAVEDWAQREHPELEWTFCAPCESQEPSYAGRCLVCGSPLRDPAEAKRQFATNVRAARIHAGLSQEDLADRAERHRTAIGFLERAERDPRLTTIVRVARALDVPVAQLLAGIE